MTIDLTLIVFVYFGFSRFLAHPMVELIMWLVGSIFLLIIGIDSLKESKNQVDFSKATPKKSLAKAFTSGFLMAVSPENIVFWIGIFGPLIISSITGPNQAHFVVVALRILLGILVHDIGLMGIVHVSRRFLNQTVLRWSAIVAAIILFGFNHPLKNPFLNA